ncbi:MULTISPECIES: NlpC/P60 family protein [unclassified Nitratireductor]|uniref:NlpC/P60 family protein n=1 Tax=unclassified Nitratireductor TaxID=2641084 RepID=UPI0025FFA39B|nr:NlpC/P60 family protein [Nitratireductor sp.]
MIYPTEEALRDAILDEASSWIGTPYRHQASRKGVGCDCLGLLRGVWRSVLGCEAENPGVYSADWAECCGEDRLLAAARRHCLERVQNDPQPGDIVLFRWRSHLPAKHIGIMTAADAFVHAYEGAAVVVSPLVPQWRRRIAGVFAFPMPASSISGK